MHYTQNIREITAGKNEFSIGNPRVIMKDDIMFALRVHRDVSGQWILGYTVLIIETKICFISRIGKLINQK